MELRRVFFSDQRRHKIVTLGGSTEHFTTNDDFRSQCLCKRQSACKWQCSSEI